jgi:hypothetical protein
MREIGTDLPWPAKIHAILFLVDDGPDLMLVVQVLCSSLLLLLLLLQGRCFVGTTLAKPGRGSGIGGF